MNKRAEFIRNLSIEIANSLAKKGVSYSEADEALRTAREFIQDVPLITSGLPDQQGNS